MRKYFFVFWGRGDDWKERVGFELFCVGIEEENRFLKVNLDFKPFFIFCSRNKNEIMKKMLFYSLVFVFASFMSCNSSKNKKEAEKIAQEFFGAIKENNKNKMQSIYPEIKNLSAYFKSDSIKINTTTMHDSIVTVSVHNRFSNGFGKIFEQDISLFLKKKRNDNLSIFDSKGLTDFNDDDEYIFALNAGCLDKNIDTTDQKIANKLEKSKSIMLEMAVDVYRELKNDIRVTEWNWEIGYNGYASGRGIFYNGSRFSIPKLKYKVTYSDIQGNPVTTDDGYVTYESLNPGDSKSFTVYTSYIGSARRAQIEPKIEDDLIFKYLSQKKWNGDECSEYYKNHPSR